MNNQIITGLPLSHSIETANLKLLFDFVSDITASVAWPLTIIIVVLIFRTQIIRAIKDLKFIRFGDTEAIFERALQRVSDKAKEIEPTSLNTRKDKNNRVSKLSGIAAKSPTSAILEAWEDVEIAVRQIVQDCGKPLAPAPEQPLLSLQKFLSEEQLLPPAEIDTFRELRVIRNRAAHTSDTEIAEDQALRYIRLSDQLLDAIKTSEAKTH